MTAWLIHLYTASGVVFAMLAMLEVCRQPTDPRLVFAALGIAVLIDATDGPLARRFDVKKRLPQIDGRKIDDLVDYLTFAFVPLLLVARMGWVPQPVELFVAPPLIASLLGFANSGAKDEEGGFFLGFPSYWNIVAFYAGIIAAHGGMIVNAIVLLALSLVTIMPVGFIYPNLAPRRWRAAMLLGGFVWTLILALMLVHYPNVSVRLLVASLVYPAFYVYVSGVEWLRRKRA
jgi:phosphatidylcholine synthase